MTIEEILKLPLDTSEEDLIKHLAPFFPITRPSEKMTLETMGGAGQEDTIAAMKAAAEAAVKPKIKLKISL